MEAQPYRSPLRRREFRLYFTGNAISNVGNWLNNVVLAVYMLELTGSSLWVGMIGLGLFLPVIAFALPAGALADRHDRMRLLLLAQVGMGVLATVLTVLAALDEVNRYILTAISFGYGIGVALAIPTMQSLIPSMVPPEEMGDAIRLNGLTFNIARAGGPVIASALLVTSGPVWAFALNAVSFWVLVLLLARIGPPPFQRPNEGEPGRAREGIVYAWQHLRTRWMLLAIVAIGITLDPIITLSPALADGYAGTTADAAGWIVAAWGMGAVLLLVVGRATIRYATEHGLGWMGLVGLAIGVAFLGASNSLPFAAIGGLIAGAGYITATMAFTTAIQSDVPESLRGRVMALWTLAFLGPRAISAVVAGALADSIGPRPATAAFGAVALGVAVAMRHIEAPPKGEPLPPPA